MSFSAGKWGRDYDWRRRPFSLRSAHPARHLLDGGLSLGDILGGLTSARLSDLTSGLTGQYAFEQERLSLNEAVARAGGLLDVRANPKQVFLYRLEHRAMLERLQVDLRAFPAEQDMIPVVYRANFRDPSSFFFAQSFPMRHKDVIYASNADVVEISKFLAFLQQVTSTAAGARRDVVVIQNPNNGL